MNVAKPPLDDLTARMAVAYAIDRDQINQIRNNGVYEIPNGPFDTKVPGYVKNPGFPKFNLKKAKRSPSSTRTRTTAQFSVVLEHTNDPANTAEAELIKQQLSKAGIDATLEAGRPDRVHQPGGHAGTSASCCGASHPGDDPDASTSGGTPARSSTSARSTTRSCRRCSTRVGARPTPRSARRIYQQVEQDVRARRSTTSGPTTGQWDIASNPKNVQGLAGPPLPDGGGKPEFIYGTHPLLGIWTRRSRPSALAGSRSRMRSAGGDWLHATIARRLVQLVVVVILATLFTFSLLRLFPGDVADAVIPLGTQGAEGSSSARTTVSTSRSSSSTRPGSATSLQGDFGKDYQSNDRR